MGTSAPERRSGGLARTARTGLARTGLVAAAALVLAACAGTEPMPVRTPETTPTPTPSASSTASPDSSDVDALTALWDAYWAAETAAMSAQDADPALWAGVVTDEIVSAKLARVADYAEHQVTYAGAPVTRDLEVEVDGDRAVLTACVDQSDWVPTSPVETVPTPEHPVIPRAFAASRTADGWVITDDGADTTGVTCS